MDVRNCRKCGRIFNYVSGPFTCPKCREDLENKFQEVKNFIRENHNVGIQEVAESCDVDTSQIYQWLREERLELGEGSSISMGCETCGAPIRSGRFCENCKKSVSEGFKSVADSMRPKTAEPTSVKKDGNSKMRFLERE